MKIISVYAFKKNLALQKPYHIAGHFFDAVENVFLQITLANGLMGYGAANPAPEVVGETTSGVLDSLLQRAAALLEGQDIRDFHTLIGHCHTAFPAQPGTQACIDIALHDAFGKFMNMSVVDLYGRQHTKMATSVTIGITDLASTLEEAAAYQSMGFRLLKLKTGRDAREDLEKIVRIKEQFGQHLTLRADANMGYSPDQLRWFMDRAMPYIELLEQPLLPQSESALAAFTPEERNLLVADESLKTTEDAIRLSAEKYYGVFNIKLMKCGGILPALALAAIARPGGTRLFWGCNDESCISIAAALHAAFACEHTRYLDLDGSLELAEDIASGGFRLEDGYLYTAGGPGLGLVDTAHAP